MTDPLAYVNDQNIEEFKRLYQKAIEENEEIFFFDDHAVLTDFAKYVVEYFEGRKK